MSAPRYPLRLAARVPSIRDSIPEHPSMAMTARFRTHRPLLGLLARSGAPASLAALLLALAACNSSGYSAKEKEQLLESHTELAQQYLEMGELDRAEGQTLKGLELDPRSVKLKLLRAKVLAKRGRPEDMQRAEKLLREIGDDGDYQVRLCLGIALERKGLAYDEAADAIESGKRITDAPDPKVRVGELRDASLKAWRESAQAYERALAEHADDTDALSGLVRVHGLLGDKAQSLAAAERLLATTQVDVEFWNKQLARTDMAADEEARFRRNVKQFSALQLATHLTASVLLHELGRDRDALAHVDAALRVDPERAELYGRRADLRRAVGDPEGAIEDIDTFLRLSARPADHPDIVRAWSLRRECEAALATARVQR